MADPWAFIAHKDGRLCGVTRPGVMAQSFLAKFIRKGCSVITVYSRQEYEAEVEKMETFERKDAAVSQTSTD